MTENKKKTVSLITPVFRVSFPAVFQPARPMNATDKPKFGVTMLFDMKDPEVAAGVQRMKDAVKAVIVGKFGPDQAKWPKGMRIPFRKGEEKDTDGYGPGVIFVAARSDRRPGLVQAWAGADGKTPAPLTDPNDFYGGCYARASVNPFWFDKGVNKGVALGLNNIQKIKDGVPFSGRKRAEDDFDSISQPPVADMDGTSGGGMSGENDLGL